MQGNGVNNYKGVLLCSRPNQNPSVNREKVFYTRVTPKEQLGIVPAKHYDEKKVRKRTLPVLANHKKWLQRFKKQIDTKKIEEENEKQKEQKRLQKMIQEGKANISALKNGETKTIQEGKSNVTLPKAEERKEQKKKKIPAWAKTEKQVQEEEQKEVDSLLQFFDTEEEIKDYLSDQELKKMLVTLKEKIQNIKEKEEEKKQQQKNNEKQKQQENDKKNDDILSRISRKSQAHSVASQKTVERVQQLQKKKQQKNWDKLTATQNKTMVSVNEQIAKNIADEVLRNYPSLKHHSNQSIRKLLQNSARQQLKQQ